MRIRIKPGGTMWYNLTRSNKQPTAPTRVAEQCPPPMLPHSAAPARSLDLPKALIHLSNHSIRQPNVANQIINPSPA